MKLKCYGSQLISGKWYGICLNFNLAAEAETIDELKTKLNRMIKSYIEAVIDTNDPDSIPVLLSRRASLLSWLKYYALKMWRKPITWLP